MATKKWFTFQSEPGLEHRYEILLAVEMFLTAEINYFGHLLQNENAEIYSPGLKNKIAKQWIVIN